MSFRTRVLVSGLAALALGACGSSSSSTSSPAVTEITAAEASYGGPFVVADVSSGAPGQVVVELRTRLYDAKAGTSTPISPASGTFDLAKEGDLFACARCVFLQSPTAEKVFVAVSGTLTLAQVDATSPSVSAGSLADVVFEERTVDRRAFTSVPATGARAHLAALSWSHPSPEGQACASADDCGTGWVCDPDRKVCNRTSSCQEASCPVGYACAREGTSGGSPACYRACSPFGGLEVGGPGCSALETCTTSVAEYGGLCLFAGPSHVNQICTADDVSTGCHQGARCTDAGHEPTLDGQCSQQCDFFGGVIACAGDQVCSPQGVCVAPGEVDGAAMGAPCVNLHARYCGGGTIVGVCAPDAAAVPTCTALCVQAPAADGTPTAGTSDSFRPACAAGNECIGFDDNPLMAAKGVAGYCVPTTTDKTMGDRFELHSASPDRCVSLGPSSACTRFQATPAGVLEVGGAPLALTCPPGGARCAVGAGPSVALAPRGEYVELEIQGALRLATRAPDVGLRLATSTSQAEPSRYGADALFRMKPVAE